MKTHEPFSFKKRIRSFKYAFNGLWRFFKTEHNLWIHCVLTLIAIVLGCILGLSKMEWIAIFIVIGMVISAEAFNTCIEKVIDYLAPDMDERAKYIKDLAAGAVLVTAVVAAIVGFIIFIPKLLALI